MAKKNLATVAVFHTNEKTIFMFNLPRFTNSTTFAGTNASTSQGLNWTPAQRLASQTVWKDS